MLKSREDEILEKIGNGETWAQMEYGKWDGFSFPFIAFHDPGYLQWLLPTLRENSEWQKTTKKQLRLVVMRSTLILPPGIKNEETEFAFFETRRGLFDGVTTVKKKRRCLPPGRENAIQVRRNRLLSIRLLDRYSRQKNASEILGESMRRLFFGHQPDVEECEAFYAEGMNFAYSKAPIF